MILQLLFKPENAVFMRVCKGFENQGKGMKTVFVEPVTPTKKSTGFVRALSIFTCYFFTIHSSLEFMCRFFGR